MIVEKGSKPGQNIVLDLPCCLILQRSNLKGIVLNGTDIENFEKAVKGEQFNGTVIYGSEGAEFAGAESGEENNGAEGDEGPEGKGKPARKKRKVSRTSSRKTYKKPVGKTRGADFDPHDVYRIDFGRR
jgi:hypothetical protein